MPQATSQGGHLWEIDDPIALFLFLEYARERHDFPRAAAAQRRLRELGVVVTYRPGRRPDRREAS